MDADGRIIPVVEGDQGEGFKDEIDPQEDPSYIERVKEIRLKESLEARKVSGAIKNIMEPQRQPQPQFLKMQLGMPVIFHGYQYKVIKILKRNRILLKFLGEIPKGGKRK